MVSGMNMRPYFEYHNPSGRMARTVLLLPGVNCGAWFMRDALPHFLPDWSVILFNNPGVDGAPIGLTLSVDEIVRRVVAVLDHLHISQVDILGHSMGGFVAQRLATLHPERVRNIVLVSTSYGRPCTEDDVKHLARIVGRDFWSFQREVATAPEQTLRVLFSHTFIEKNYDKYQRFIAMRTQHFPGALASGKHILCGAQFSNIRGTGNLKHRTLVVHGAQDILVSIKSGTLLASQIPHAQLWRIEQCGHFPMIEDANFYTATRQFLEGENVGDFVLTFTQKPAGMLDIMRKFFNL
jgi:2-hydroxymuconate-semialdehyde hydrolase